MWTRTSLMLLATLVVSGFSLPRPDDAEYNIPSVGTGQRSQYYVLHSDGTFKYGFDTGEGAYESVKSHSVGNRHGKFGYVDPEGKTIHLEYEAGEGGFVARGDHLPKPSPQLAEALAAVVSTNTPFVDPLADGNLDPSYGFQFESADHSRNEQSDSDGTVTGSYSYVDENGQTRSFTYRAGKGIGFVIEGDGLTQDLNTTPSVSQSNFHHTTRKSSVTNNGLRTRTPTRTTNTVPTTHREANVAFVKSDEPWDASYSFSYDAGDHSRSENSDPNLNVDGKFSFVADDGVQRTVNYVAGSSTGFVAQGDHLPRAPAAIPSIHSSVSRRTQSQRAPASTSSVHSAVSKRTQQPKTSWSSSTRQQHTGDSSSQSGTPRDASYSFSYNTNDHSRSETSDPNLNVDGQFSFVADDGVERTVNYVAGSSTGFVAQGDHLPRAPAPITPTHSSVSQRTPASFSHGHSTVSQRTQSPKTSWSSSTGQQHTGVSSSQFGTPRDASYSFSYNTDDHSRSETSDSNLNVDGKFSFVADDGVERTVNYVAGSSTGFVAQGDHLPKAPASISSGHSAVSRRTQSPKTSWSSSTGQQPSEVSSSQFGTPRDASYSFSYNTEDHSRSETSDPNLNIDGKFSFVADDGVERTVNYVAGSSTGFVAQGDHLPRATAHISSDHSAVSRRTQSPKTSLFSSTGQQHTGAHRSTAFTSASSRPQQSAPVSSHNFGTSQTLQRQRPTGSYVPPHKTSHNIQSFPDFTLNTYDVSPTSEKFGYVLRFD